MGIALKKFENGPETWHNLHIATVHLGRPSSWNRLTVARTAIDHIMRPALICSGCRMNLRVWLRKNRISAGTDLFAWSWRLHEAVNGALKKTVRPSLEESRSYWTSEHAKLSRGQLAQMGLAVQ